MLILLLLYKRLQNVSFGESGVRGKVFLHFRFFSVPCLRFSAHMCSPRRPKPLGGGVLSLRSLALALAGRVFGAVASDHPPRAAAAAAGVHASCCVAFGWCQAVCGRRAAEFWWR